MASFFYSYKYEYYHFCGTSYVHHIYDSRSVSLKPSPILIAKNTNSVLSCIRKHISSSFREVIHLLCSVLVRSHTGCRVLFCTPQNRRHGLRHGTSSAKGHKDCYWTEASAAWRKTKRAGTVLPGQKQTWGDLIYLYTWKLGMRKMEIDFLNVSQ